MNEPGKITASHLSRTAVIYVRQSTLIQVERNTESTARQYDLASRARQLGWPREAIRVIDGDLGISGSVTGQRDGFEGMIAEVALGQVGIGQPAGHRRGPRRLRAAAGPGHLRHLRPQAGHLLHWPGECVPNYYCQGSAELVNGRGARHMSTGGQTIDAAVAGAFLAALAPAALDACLQAAAQLEDGHDAALAQHQRQVEQARYHASRAERRYRAVDPDNRLVARGLETEWEQALRELAGAEAELARRQAARPKALTAAERTAILALGDDLGQVWYAPTTTGKDRKQLLRTLLEEVSITLRRDDPGPHAALALRWKGGAISELTVPLRRRQPAIRTDEDTISLIRRLAVHYPDAQIAGILNRQQRRTARGLSYTASRVQSLRHHWKIPCHQHSGQAPEGELLSVTAAARQLGIAPSTLLRWLAASGSLGGVDWVEVSDEPHHVELFRNDAVRVYEARVEPGTATLYHHHTLDTVYVIMAGGTFRSEEPVHQKSSTELGRSVSLPTKLLWGIRRAVTRGTLQMPAGTVFMQHHGAHPLIHRVVASSKNVAPIRMLGIELHATSHPPVLATGSGVHLEYADERARTYRVQREMGEWTGTLTPAHGAVLAVITGTGVLSIEGTEQRIVAGSASCIAPTTDVRLGNPEATTLSCLLIVI